MSDWKYDLEEVGPDAEEENEGTESLESGSPSPENAAFVLLGALVTVLVFVRLVAAAAP